MTLFSTYQFYVNTVVSYRVGPLQGLSGQVGESTGHARQYFTAVGITGHILFLSDDDQAKSTSLHPPFIFLILQHSEVDHADFRGDARIGNAERTCWSHGP